MHGETRKIRILLEGKDFDAELKNQGFDQDDFAGHADVVQIRYGVKLANYLRTVFAATWDYVEVQKALPENINRKVVIKIPTEQQEFMALSSTTLPDVFVLDSITVKEKAQIGKAVGKMEELDYETSFMPAFDPHASIQEIKRIQKVRKLDRSIGDNLKRLYNYRCQMTGEAVGEEHGVHVVEAHHIESFITSLNNDSTNQIILSPSYHRIVHQANPQFDRSKLAFVFPNGLVEKVKVNKHL